MSFRYSFIKRNSNSIASRENLLKALDLDEAILQKFENTENSQRYSELKVPKSDGRSRTVHNPDQTLRAIQRRVNTRIFHPKSAKGGLINWPDYLFGSIPNEPNRKSHFRRDYIACAAQHCGAKRILKMDISDFFDNIHEEHVLNIFINLLKFPTEVAKILTDICCHNGNVVQGALTSSYIASAVLFDLEPVLVKKLHTKGLVYTRLVDDITISSKSSDYNFDYAKTLVTDMLYAKGLPTNQNKTQILTASSSEALVHGLRVCFAEPRLPSSEVARIRASVQHVERFASDPEFRTSKEYRNIFNRALGRVNRLEQIGHNQHKILLDRLNRIPPKPDKRDIRKAIKLTFKVIEMHKKFASGYHYKRLYYRAQYELNILQRTFKKTASSLRAKLREHKPEYED